MMNSNPESGEIFKYFPSLDVKERELRAKIDLLIKTNALDELTKEQEMKKEKFVPGVDFVAVGIGLSFGVFAASFLFSPKIPKIQKP